MRSGLARFSVVLFTATAFAGAAQAQSACVNTAPNPYHEVSNWATTPRPWAHPLVVATDTKDDLWAFDRCEDAGCAGSTAAPIFELTPDGKTIRNFGAGLFVFPHAIKANADGTIWAVDGNAKNGKGNQVFKFSPDGKILMSLGKPGQGGGSARTDTFDQPTDIAVARNGDLFIAEGHGPKYGNSRIDLFDRHGKFLKTIGERGSGDGQLLEPHAISLDSRGRLFVADRANNRVSIFDRHGKFVAAWKQFGRPSGLWVDQHDMLYVTDSESSPDPKDPAYNPGCAMGIRIGSAKTGKVTAYIPPPPITDPKAQPPEGIAVDSHGTIYAAAQFLNTIFKYVRN